MIITSVSFILFIAALVLVYYAVPKRWQWVVLLLASGVFYLSCGVKNALYVLVTASSVYGATRWMDNLSQKQKAYLRQHKGDMTKEEKTAFKAKQKARRKAILIGTLLLNLGLMCYFKYIHFAIDQLNALFSCFTLFRLDNSFSFVIPLGISFYTFQAVGYLVNVYWENWEPEKNYLKVLLFVSFFPQTTQGPISEFDQLSRELFAEHSFTYENYSWGFQRMLWGFVKKMVLANALAPFVADVFLNYGKYTGITTFLGALMYSVQIYADFSGYMDIMCGLCQILGIRLTENFERPYFSKSIAEYWRRWHITLGAWFKSYIYYPIAISKRNLALGRNVKKKYGDAVGKNLPASLALVVVWLATGLWHGASWAYIAWGGVNGLFIILSLWMEPLYDRWKKALRIRESAWLWRAFQTVRTFLLVTFIKVLPEVGTLSQGWGLWKHIFTDHRFPHTLRALLPFVRWDLTVSKAGLAAACVLVPVLFVVSLLQRKKPVREYFNTLPAWVRITILACTVILIAMIGVPSTWGEEGFMYANF